MESHRPSGNHYYKWCQLYRRVPLYPELTGRLPGATSSYINNTGANNLLSATTAPGLRALVTCFSYNGNPATFTLNGFDGGSNLHFDFL